MNNKRIGKIAVTAIVSIISTITAVAVTELTKGIKKDVESLRMCLRNLRRRIP